MTLPNSEPLKVSLSKSGDIVQMEESVFDGVMWSLRKWDLMKGPPALSADEAEAIIRREMAERRREAP